MIFGIPGPQNLEQGHIHQNCLLQNRPFLSSRPLFHKVLVFDIPRAVRIARFESVAEICGIVLQPRPPHTRELKISKTTKDFLSLPNA